MSIEWFRDLVICIWGLVTTGLIILIAVLAFLMYRRIRPILDSIKTTSATIQEISSYVGDEIVKPLAQLIALIQGIRHGIDNVSEFFKKKEGGGND